MKKFLFVIFGLVLTLAAGSVNAQRVKAINGNNTEQYAKSKVTTDSVLYYIDSVNVGTDEAGILEVKYVGYAKDTAYAITGVKKVRFNKRRGTLTLGTVIDEQAEVADAALGTATVSLVAANNKIYVRIKGKNGLNITWYTLSRRFGLTYL
jgi:hypothetical protein